MCDSNIFEIWDAFGNMLRWVALILFGRSILGIGERLEQQWIQNLRTLVIQLVLQHEVNKSGIMFNQRSVLFCQYNHLESNSNWERKHGGEQWVKEDKVLNSNYILLGYKKGVVLICNLHLLKFC